MAKLKKIAFYGAASLLSAVVVGELFSKFYLGLGTPPLSITHTSIEYMFKPNQSVTRFGNSFASNEYGMRSDSLAEKSLDELRIMVFGDSVINGGNLTDQSELATVLLQQSL